MARAGDGYESEPLVGVPLDPLARSRDAGAPETDLVVAGTVYYDIVFTALSAPPAVGTEVHTEGMGSCPGGVANVAVAGSRLGLADALWRQPSARTSTATSPGRPSPSRSSSTCPALDDFRTGTRRSPCRWVTAATGVWSPTSTSRRSRCTSWPPDCRRLRAVFTSLNAAELPDWIRLRATRGELIFADVGWDQTERWSPQTLEQLSSCHAFMPNAVEAMAYTRTGNPESALAKLADLVPVAVVTDGAGAPSPSTSSPGSRPRSRGWSSR